MNYTKGEWRVSNKSFGGAETDGNLVIWSPNGIVAMACTIHEGLINAEANAHLIAVAPKLYEFCEELLNALRKGYECIGAGREEKLANLLAEGKETDETDQS